MTHLVLVLSVVSLVLFINFVIMTLLIMAFGYPPRLAVVTGIMLSQIGEFSFLLIEMERGAGHISADLYQVLLSVAFMTMFMTPLIFASIPGVLKILSKFSIFGVPPQHWNHPDPDLLSMKNHVILCGFGPTGHDLATAFMEEQVPFIVIEMNPVKIREAKRMHQKVLYGDASNQEVLKRAGIARARAVIVSFPDALGITQIIRTVQDLNPQVLLAVRTRFVGQMSQLYELGADIVVTEEWEASHELNQVVLQQLEIPKERIEHHLGRIRSRKEVAVEEAIFLRKNLGFFPKERTV